MATNQEGGEVIQMSPPKFVPHLHTIILLHEKGSNGSEFRDQVFSAETRPLLDRPRTLNKLYDCCRWVFPDAPNLDETQDETSQDGSVARQWFHTPDMWDPQDSPGQHPALEQSIEHVLAIVKEEAKWIGIQHVFIGGFGQGFAVAAGAILVDGTGDFAGLIGLNGWLPFSQQLVEEMHGQPHSAWVNRIRSFLAPKRFPEPPDRSWVFRSCPIIQRNEIHGSKNTPIFLAHPRYDDVVPYTETVRTSEVFQAMGWAELEWRPYPFEDGVGQPNHGINAPRGIDDLSWWLSDQFTNCPRHPRSGHIFSYINAQILDGF